MMDEEHWKPFTNALIFFVVITLTVCIAEEHTIHLHDSIAHSP